MKKFIVFALLALSCAVTAVCFAGCIGDTLKYGEKYGRDADCYIFYKDGTGRHERYYKGDSVNSYTIYFLWQVQSDNAIYLVFDSVEYNDDHTAAESIDADDLVNYPIYYSSDMISYNYVSGYTSVYTRTYKFIRQNSRLDTDKS